MGKRRRKFDLGKNYELTLKVKVPLNLLKPFVVSIPLASYVNAPASSGQALVARLVATNQLPSGWSYSSTTLYKVQCTQQQPTPSVTFSLTISDTLTWALNIGSIPILPTHLPAVPSKLIHYHQLVSLLLTLDNSKLCIGNPDEKYMSLIKSHHGNLHDQTGTLLYDHGMYIYLI